MAAAVIRSPDHLIFTPSSSPSGFGEQRMTYTKIHHTVAEGT